MTEAEKQKLDRIASRFRGPRTHAENLRRHLENLDPGISRAPTCCTGCGQQQGAPHLVGCKLAAFV